MDLMLRIFLPLFARNKTGILGWRSEKSETVNGYEAKVRRGPRAGNGGNKVLYGVQDCTTKWWNMHSSPGFPLCNASLCPDS